MPKYVIIFCIIVFCIMVSALFWGLEYFLNPGYEAYVWDQYEEKVQNTDIRAEFERTPFGSQLQKLFQK